MRISKDQYQSLDTCEGREVEVCCDSKEGWYKAIIEIMRPISKGCIHRGVRLLKDNFATHLRLPYRDRIRPVPPAHLLARVEIKEGCVVDADHSFGWWTGLVIKELEDDKFLVFFDSPLDITLFHRKHLRPHLDWVLKKYWVEPAPGTRLFKRLTEESIFSSGTMVEVSSKTNKMEAVWVPAMIIKEIEEDDVKKYIVKFCDKPSSCKGNKANVTVDSERVRPTQPPFSVEKYKLLESVEAFRGSKWRKGVVRRIISQNLYMIYFKATKKQLKFNHSDLRTPMEWEDGVWKRRESPSEEGSGNKMDSSVMNGNTSSESSLGNEAVSPVTLSPVINSMPLKQTEAETQGHALPEKTLQPTRDLDSLENDSTQDKTRESPLAEESGNTSSLADEAVSPVNLSPVISSTPLKQTEAETQGQALPKKTLQPTRILNGLGNNSTQEKGKPEKETPSNGKTNKSVTLETSYVQSKELPLAPGLGNSMTNSVMKANESVFPVTPSPVINATLLKQTASVTQGKTILTKTPQPMKNQNGLANGLTRETVKKSSEDNIRKRKREETVSSVANVDGNKAKDTAVALPFEKKLPIWKKVESMEVFKTLPQSPHFSPLAETRENSREMSAVGMMLTFSGLIEEVKHLQPFSPKSTLESLNGSFVELEKHGFDVKEPQSRIRKLLSLTDGQAKKMDELQGVEEKIGEKESKKVEIEEKILKLQREKEEAEDEIAEMKSCAIRIGQELEDMELQFHTTVSAQW